MGIVWAIAAKDLRLRIRDRSILLIAFVVPIGLAGLFSVLFGGLAEGSLGEVRYGVADLDRGEVAEAFVDQYLPTVAGFLAEDGTDVQVVPTDSAADAEALVRDGELDAAFVLPGDLSTALRDARPVDLRVITSADASVPGDVAAALASQFVQQARGQLAARLLGERLQLDEEQAAEFARSAGTVQGRISLDASTTAGRVLGTSAYIIAGMAVFFVFFTVQFGVLGYLEERRDGTLPRLLASPIARWQVLGAKALVSLVAGTASVAALLLAGRLALGARWGDPIGVAMLVLAVVVAATALVAVVAGVARTPEQANTVQSVVAIVLGMLGGSFFPLTTGPDWLATLSLATPHAWFLRGLGELAAGGGPGDVLLPVGAMLLFAAVVGALAPLLARRADLA